MGIPVTRVVASSSSRVVARRTHSMPSRRKNSTDPHPPLLLLQLAAAGANPSSRMVRWCSGAVQWCGVVVISGMEVVG